MKKTTLFKIIFFVITFLSFLGGAMGHASDFAVIGDVGHWNNNAEILRNSILKQKITRLFIPGDNLYDLKSGYSKAWQPWIDKKFDFSAVAVGNHNLSYAEEMKFFKLSNDHYKREFGDAIVFVLNSDNEKNVTQQMTWLEQELSQLKLNFKKAAKAKPVFLLFHHPPYTLSQVHDWEEKKTFHIELRKILKKYSAQIIALLLGHDHFASAHTFGDTVAMVSGAGQNLRTVQKTDNLQDGVPVKTLFYYSLTPMWIHLQIANKSESKWGRCV